MRARSFAILCMAAWLACGARAEPVVTGQSPFTRSYVRALLESDTGASRQSLETTLLDSLISDGFFGADVRWLGPDCLKVESGERYRISAVRWRGDSAQAPETVWNRIPLHSGRVFEFPLVDLAAQQLLDWAEENGYPFARIEVDSLELAHGIESVTPHLRFLTGPLIKIEFVRFGGNRISQAKLLLRESRLRVGAPYRESRVRQARRRLAQLEYLRQVREPQLVADETGRSGLLIEVEENKLSRLDVVAGLAPATDGEAQTVTGLVDLQLLNLFGSGRRAKVYWQKPASGVQELALGWREVWIAGTPFHSDFAFTQRVEDTLYVTRKFGARVGYPVSPTVELFVGVGREELLSDSATAVALGLVTQQTDLLETGFAVDTRDHPTNARAGLRFETAAATATRKSDTPPVGSTKRNFTQQRGSADGEYYREMFPNWILAVLLHGRATLSDEPEIPVYDRNKVGGARTLRGYREEQFLGSQAAWGSLEARYWLGPASRLAVFFDGGTIGNESLLANRAELDWMTEFAYGAGLRLETGIGVWGIDYGIASGVSPLNGQLHVSLLSLF